jgi:hypothetical protein
LSNDDKPIWRIEEVLDETADPVVALDALSMLSEVGLIRRRGDFIVITVAATRTRYVHTRHADAQPRSAS